MSEEDISFYSKINNTKIKKGPILRVQQKKANKMVNSKSMTNINRNYFNLKMPKTMKKLETDLINKYIHKKPMKKYDSLTYFPKSEIYHNNKTITEGKIWTNKDDDNKKEKFDKRKKINKDKNNFNDENKIKIDNDKNQQEPDLYCINCINKKMNIKKNLYKYLKRNNSYDFTLEKNFSLSQLDEDYINNKIIQNERRQLAAFNQLKKYKEKNPKSKKDKLQELYENSE